MINYSRVILLALVASLAFLEPANAQWIADGVPVCGAAGMQREPVAAPDGGGGIILCWLDDRTGLGSSDIYAQRIDNMGRPQWQTDGVPVCTALDAQWEPAVMSDGQGGVFIIWVDQRLNQWHGDIYAQRLDPDGQALWAPDGIAICTATRPQRHPALVPDGSDGAIALWEDERSGGGDLYIQRVESNGNLLWAPDGITFCSNPSDKQRPHVAADDAGGAFITWADNRSLDSGPDIYVQRISNEGVPYWDPEGVAVCTYLYLQWSTGIAPDGAGGAIAVWDDCRLGYWWEDCAASDIYAQRVDAMGATQWDVDGVEVAGGLLEQSYSRIVADGQGGAIVSWEEAFQDVFAQRVDSDGARLWAPLGVPLSSMPGIQHLSGMIPDGVGGAIIAWRHDSDVYAGRVNGLGQPLWGDDGFAIAAVLGVQQWPTLATDGWGGALFAWQDGRSGTTTNDIYAQRVTGSGSIPTAVPDAGPPAFALSECVPNPFSGHTTLQLSLARESVVTFQVYDATGRLVSASRGNFAPGAHEIEFDGTDGNGRRLSSGVYFARVMADGASISRKMIIVR